MNKKIFLLIFFKLLLKPKPKDYENFINPCIPINGMHTNPQRRET